MSLQFSWRPSISLDTSLLDQTRRRTLKHEILDEYKDLHVVRYCKEGFPRVDRPFLLYVHGGPGSHPGDFEVDLRTKDSLSSGPFDWVVYHQRGCGQSDTWTEVTHDDNIRDLEQLCKTLPTKLAPSRLVGVFGHSYGARLAFETFFEHPEIRLKLLLAGRAIQPEDSMNLSALMDLYILRNTDRDRFAEAYALAARCEGSISSVGRQIKELFSDQDLRQQQREQYYWGNLEALKLWKQAINGIPLKDNDDVFYSVSASIRSRAPRVKIYDPSLLKQDCLLLQGFWDFMMAGATKPPIDDSYVVKFNGSGHYPHFEETEKFLSVAKSFFLK